MLDTVYDKVIQPSTGLFLIAGYVLVVIALVKYSKNTFAKILKYRGIIMYRIMILASFVLGISMSAFLLRRKKVPLRIIMMSLSLELLLCVYLSLITTYLLSGMGGYGLNSTGGAIGMLLGAFIFSFITPQYKTDFWEAYTLVLPLMYGLGKVGCSFAGCCGGIQYNGLFHVADAKGDVFPVQILEALVFLLIFALSFLVYFKGRFDPLLAAIIYSSVKILLDFLRDTHADRIISSNQIMCFAVILLLLVIRQREYHGLTKKKSKVQMTPETHI